MVEDKEYVSWVLKRMDRPPLILINELQKKLDLILLGYAEIAESVSPVLRSTEILQELRMLRHMSIHA